MIRVKEMKAGYGNRTVVELEELSFLEGSVTCILGKNGCGKSTFLRALAGILRYQGSVEADGRELLDIPSEERARLIGYLPQKIVQADMTVSMLVAHGRFPWKSFPRRLNEEDWNRIRAAMDRAGIRPLAEKNLKEISGGELKLSYVAMLLAQDTKVLLLDEPEAHLDQEHQELLYTILLELAAEGRTVIVVSHDLLKSMNYGNRVCVFRGGRAVLYGPPEEVVKNGDALQEALGVTIVPAVQEGSRYRYIFGRS